MGRNSGNSRNGTRTKPVLGEIGPVEIEVWRDRDGSFDPASDSRPDHVDPLLSLIGWLCLVVGGQEQLVAERASPVFGVPAG